uniref:ATP synthase F0 subunit 8 n=1 Tax=Lottia digitalis TaxID=225159 RepID=Q2I6Z4_9GAST|nr:ATP synthase F0 subunit 8 [Lottia digitalis]ABC00935.1 ATP synthase F0 subunit 8 [Lottia digitalis]
MPQLAPMEWLFVYILVWSTIMSIFLEIYWLPTSQFFWESSNSSSKKGHYTYTWTSKVTLR